MKGRYDSGSNRCMLRSAEAKGEVKERESVRGEARLVRLVRVRRRIPVRLREILPPPVCSSFPSFLFSMWGIVRIVSRISLWRIFRSTRACRRRRLSASNRMVSLTFIHQRNFRRCCFSRSLSTERVMSAAISTSSAAVSFVSDGSRSAATASVPQYASAQSLLDFCFSPFH